MILTTAVFLLNGFSSALKLNSCNFRMIKPKCSRRFEIFQVLIVDKLRAVAEPRSTLFKSFFLLFFSSRCACPTRRYVLFSFQARQRCLWRMCCCWLSVPAALIVSFLRDSMGSGQQQWSRPGGGGQEHHGPCGLYSCSALPQPPYGVDP